MIKLKMKKLESFPKLLDLIDEIEDLKNKKNDVEVKEEIED